MPSLDSWGPVSEHNGLQGYKVYKDTVALEAAFRCGVPFLQSWGPCSEHNVSRDTSLPRIRFSTIRFPWK